MRQYVLTENEQKLIQAQRYSSLKEGFYAGMLKGLAIVTVLGESAANEELRKAKEEAQIAHNRCRELRNLVYGIEDS